MKNPRTPQISSFAAAETTRRAIEDCVLELQLVPAASMRIVKDVTLADGVVTPVAHRLGRAPVWVRESCPRGASTTGRVEEIRNGTHNRDQIVALKATGWGATITVDLAVM